MPEILMAALAGAVVTTLGTPAGMSGAVFLLPVQISLLGVAGPAVSATNLLFNIIATPVAVIRMARRALPGSRELAVVITTGIPAVALGVLARVTVLADPARFRVVFALVLLGLGLRSALRARRPSPTAATTASGENRPLRRRTLAALTAPIAVLGGVLGIGGGSLLAPTLVGLLRYPARAAALLALATTLTTSVAGLACYTLLEATQFTTTSTAPNWRIGLALAAGGLVGSLAGTSLQYRLSERLLSALVGTAAIATALAYLLRT
ncbi:MAG: TSUP family transporter [Pseudonocardiaceae bacterium]|nr:TSUP family transporter [Pseudonocardiaceae bacterium]